MMVRKFLLGVLPVILVACGGGGGGGGGGEGGGAGANVQQPVTSARVRRLDSANLFYRIPSIGDQMDYDYVVTGDATVDGVLATTFYDHSPGSPWSDLDNYTFRSQTVTLPDGTSLFFNNAYIDGTGDMESARVTSIDDDDGYFFHYDSEDETFYLGNINLPRLDPGQSFTEEWEQDLYFTDDYIEAQTNYAISANSEQISTGIGVVEVYRITSNTTETEYYSWGGEKTRQEDSTILWVHPQIGMVKSQVSIRIYEDPFSFPNEFTSVTGTAILRRVNFTLPSAN